MTWGAGIACAALVAPGVLYLWYVLHFGVNVPFQDTWNGSLPLLQDLNHGRLSLALLWAPHNENRMLFPNLVLTFLDSVTRMNEHIDMLVSAGLFLIATFLLCWLACRSLGVHLAWLIPLPWLILGLAQVENTLWAFQFAWMLVLLCTSVCLALTELGPNRPLYFGACCVVAVVASLSLLQGLLIWPVGLVFGVACGWRRRYGAVWVATGIATTAGFFWHIGPAQPSVNPLYTLSHPELAAQFFLKLVGAVFIAHSTLLGAAVCLVALAAALAAVRSGGWRRLRLPLSLGILAILFDLLVTEGRVQFGLSDAGASRYTTYNLLLLAMIYVAAVAAAGPPQSLVELGHLLRLRSLSSLALVGVAILALCQIAWGVPNGLYVGRVYYVNRTIGAHLLRMYPNESAAVLGRYLFYPEGRYVKEWAPVLKENHWSVFSDRAD